MKGDFTRFSHQPRRDYAAVLMQQGRVTLDADWNEQLAIEDHRWRVQTIDTIGEACAPVNAAGFGLSFTPDGTDLIIGEGRIYIDGLLVENHHGSWVDVEAVEGRRGVVSDLAPDGIPFAAGQWVEVSWDDPQTGTGLAVGKITDVDDTSIALDFIGASVGDPANAAVRRLVTYLTQPYYHASAPPPFGDPFVPGQWGGQTHLFYLDVWRRHVTAVEDPRIREVALGGPDTATRVQTAWALRILTVATADGSVPFDATGMACHDELDLWDDLVARKAGRMSARAEAAADPEDPCAIVPGAGYRGLENRLYRVEIHDPGLLGTATFKWSRDNGSILAAIVDFPEVDSISVHSLGKDQVLRFSADDRVEVFGEESEFSGLPGTMAVVVGQPDEAERIIELSVDVSLYEDHHLPRVRRWDQPGDPIPTSAGFIELEDGVQVRFEDGPFYSGDYWVVPARVATGDVEGFIDALPRGIYHHYARVALVSWPADSGAILDCRHLFPPLCEIEAGGPSCCTVTVGEGGDFASIQAAVDSLVQVQGPAQICLLPGEHRVTTAVDVVRGNLTISGCGRRSQVIATGGSALLLRDVTDVRIEDIWIFSASVLPTIAMVDCTAVEVIDCRIANLGRADLDRDDEFSVPTTGVTTTHGLFDGDGLVPTDFARDADPVAAMRNDAKLASSFVVQRSAGPAVASVISRFVKIRDCVVRGFPAITLQGDNSWIEHNIVSGGGVWIREGSDVAVISDNTITRGHGQGVLLGGLIAGESPRDDRAGVNEIDIVDNRIDVMTREAVSTPFGEDDRLGDVSAVTIARNVITRCGLAPIADGVAMGGGIFIRDGSAVRIHDNEILDNGPVSGSGERFAMGFGIGVVMCIGLDVQDNRIVGNGRETGASDEAITLNAGIAALGVLPAASGTLILNAPALIIQGNEIASTGGPGIAAFGVGPMAIDDNTITCLYAGRTVLEFGRAILLLNLGAAPDIGLIQFARRRVVWPLLHGSVSVDSNQVSVQGTAFGLDPRDPDFDPDQAPVGEMRAGSAVAVMSFDDIVLEANHVLNELAPLRDAFGRIRSTVWASSTTLRTTTNRVTELPLSALRSYVGIGAGHNASDNITTHCMRVDGLFPAGVVNRDNIELLCPRFEPVPGFIHVMYGG